MYLLFCRVTTDDEFGIICCLVASLLSCLYQLKAENRTLEERISAMTARRDRLLAVNARLSVPLGSPGSNSHIAEPDTQPNQLDNGVMDDSASRHGKSPRSTAAPLPNYTSIRVRPYTVNLFICFCSRLAECFYSFF